MNLRAILTIYQFQISRTWRTSLQSICAPVLSTSLYFVVFGSAIGSHRMPEVDGISYGAFIVPGLVMLSLFTQSISNASFAIYFPRFTGTIYELLSAPVSHIDIVVSYVSVAASKSIMLAMIILATSSLFVPLRIAHPAWMILFMAMTVLTFSLLGLIIGIWADNFEAPTRAASDRHAAQFSGRKLLFGFNAAAILAKDHAVQPSGLSDQRLSLELLWHCRRSR